MKAKLRFDLLLAFAMVSGAAIGLTSSWAHDDDSPSTSVGKAECRRSDNPETGLQGQIPMPDRLAGFQGFNCNLKETTSTSASRGDGLWQQFAYAHDRAGHLCGYAGGTFFSNNPGTVVVDLTDPDHSVQTALLTTPGMITPGEGLRAHEGRGLLVSGNYQTGVPPIPNGSVADGFDVYDIGTDCRHPQLLVSTTTLEFGTTGLVPYPGDGAWQNPDRIYGHEGAFAPDGMTYYLSDVPHDVYHAIDLSNPSKPRMLASFVNPFLSRQTPLTASGAIHGLSISSDGKRAYVSSVQLDLASATGATPATGTWHEGFVIFDTREIQERKPNPQVRVVGESYWNDATANQMTIPVKIQGKQYLITTEEGGSGQFNAKGDRSACAAGRTPFGMARIHDIENESAPRTVAKLILEANEPANCSIVDPEIGAVNGFVYDVHMCSVDDREDATTMACGYFQSGIRVYDIRDPRHVKEIAYFTPPAKTVGAGGFGPGPGWCAAIPFLDAKSGMLYSSCADTGIVSLKFNDDVWPFHNSKTPSDKQL